jgi:hypothetical protein
MLYTVDYINTLTEQECTQLIKKLDNEYKFDLALIGRNIDVDQVVNTLIALEYRIKNFEIEQLEISDDARAKKSLGAMKRWAREV